MMPGHGQRIPIEPRRYDRPAIVRIIHTLKLGDPKTLVFHIGFTRDYFRPNRLVCNIPSPGCIIITDIEWGKHEPQFIGDMMDAFDFHTSRIGVNLALPPLEKDSEIIMTAEYTGAVPKGMVSGNPIDLIFIWAEPGVGLALNNFDDITRKVDLHSTE